MYNGKEIFRVLTSGQIGICVKGDLEGYKLYYLNNMLHIEHPDGTVERMLDSDVETNGKTRWEIISN